MTHDACLQTGKTNSRASPNLEQYPLTFKPGTVRVGLGQTGVVQLDGWLTVSRSLATGPPLSTDARFLMSRAGSPTVPMQRIGDQNNLPFAMEGSEYRNMNRYRPRIGRLCSAVGRWPGVEAGADTDVLISR